MESENDIWKDKEEKHFKGDLDESDAIPTFINFGQFD